MIRRVRRSGSSFVITIPREIMLAKGFVEGDFLCIPDDQISKIKRDEMSDGHDECSDQ